MKRKSPYKHSVTSHTRKGKPVRPYSRGNGMKPYKVTKRRRTVGKVTDETEVGPKSFTCNFKYSNRRGDGESLIVIADTYEKALDEAFEEKADNRWPIEVELVDPSLGAVLSFIGRGAKKAGKIGLKGLRKAKKLGAKYAIKAGHIAKQEAIRIGKAGYKSAQYALRESAKLAISEIQKKRVKFLIRDAYSKDKLKRKAARWALKRYYPDVYDICSFSRDRNLPKKKKTKKKTPKKRLRPPKTTYIRLPQRYVPYP